MAQLGATGRRDLGSLLVRALSAAGERWASLLGLAVLLQIALPIGLNFVRAPRYMPGSHEPAAFAGLAVSMLAPFLAALLGGASIMVVGLRDVGAVRAVLRVLRRLPVLWPWWVLVSVPTLFTLWSWWAVASPAQLSGYLYPRLFVGALFGLVNSTIIGMFPLVVLGEDRSLVPSLARTWRLMSGRRAPVLALAVTLGATALALNLALPFLSATAFNAGWDMIAVQAITYTFYAVFAGIAVCGNLAYAALYFELARSEDGVAATEIEQVFA